SVLVVKGQRPQSPPPEDESVYATTLSKPRQAQHHLAPRRRTPRPRARPGAKGRPAPASAGPSQAPAAVGWKSRAAGGPRQHPLAGRPGAVGADADQYAGFVLRTHRMALSPKRLAPPAQAPLPVVASLPPEHPPRVHDAAGRRPAEAWRA